MTLNVVGWLLDAGTEHERTLAGAAWVPSRGGTTNEPLVLRIDAEAAIAQLRVELQAWKARFPQYRYRPQNDCVALDA